MLTTFMTVSKLDILCEREKEMILFLNNEVFHKDFVSDISHFSRK